MIVSYKLLLCAILLMPISLFFVAIGFIYGIISSAFKIGYSKAEIFNKSEIIRFSKDEK